VYRGVTEHHLPKTKGGTMKILLINIDSKIPNLALKKIEKYHLDNGDNVEWDFPLMAHQANRIYVSCVFERNRYLCKQWEDIAFIGGSGYDIKKKLPDILENVKPHINLGFTTRGCIRNCKFCIVPQKEGKIRAVGDLLDLWDGKSKDVVLLDNNILALPEHFKMICKQARENKIRVDFNQGLDCRLLTQDMVDDLKSIRHTELHFAWDDLKYEEDVVKAIDLLQKNNINRCTWLMITGFNTTIDEDIYRAKYLKSRNQNAYVMRYNFSKRKDLIPLSRWVNNRAWFQAISWEKFLEINYKKGVANG